METTPAQSLQGAAANASAEQRSETVQSNGRHGDPHQAGPLERALGRPPRQVLDRRAQHTGSHGGEGDARTWCFGSWSCPPRPFPSHRAGTTSTTYSRSPHLVLIRASTPRPLIATSRRGSPLEPGCADPHQGTTDPAPRDHGRWWDGRSPASQRTPTGSTRG